MLSQLRLIDRVVVVPVVLCVVALLGLLRDAPSANAAPFAPLASNCDTYVVHHSHPDSWNILCIESCGGAPPCGNVGELDSFGQSGVACATCPQNQNPPRCCHAVMLLGPLFAPSTAGSCAGSCGPGSCTLGSIEFYNPDTGDVGTVWWAACG